MLVCHTLQIAVALAKLQKKPAPQQLGRLTSRLWSSSSEGFGLRNCIWSAACYRSCKCSRQPRCSRRAAKSLLETVACVVGFSSSREHGKGRVVRQIITCVSSHTIRRCYLVSTTLHYTNAAVHNRLKPEHVYNYVQSICACTATFALSYQEYQKYHRKYRRCTQRVCPCFLARIWTRHRNDKGPPPTT
jgi:hypothetical protein